MIIIFIVYQTIKIDFFIKNCNYLNIPKMSCPVCLDDDTGPLYASSCHHPVCKTCIPKIATIGNSGTNCVDYSSIREGVLHLTIFDFSPEINYTCPICRYKTRGGRNMAFHPLPRQDVPEISKIGDNVMDSNRKTMEAMSVQFEVLKKAWTSFPELVSEVNAKIEEKKKLKGILGIYVQISRIYVQNIVLN